MDEIKVESMLTLMDEREQRMEKTLDKLFEAIYGNGEPGLKETTRSLEARVAGIETSEKACPVWGIDPKVQTISSAIEGIVKRHDAEDEQKKATAAEMRKFRYTLAAAIVTFALDFALRLIK